MDYLVIDVDGVLNAFNPLPGSGYTEYKVRPDCRWWNPDLELRVWLNKTHGRWLTELATATGSQLVWGTGWEGAANDWIGPTIGLPQMPVVPIPDRNDERIPFGTWKARQITSWVGSERFVWFEDEADAGPAAAQYATGSHLVVKVDPQSGLTRDNLAQARKWLAT